MKKIITSQNAGNSTMECSGTFEENGGNKDAKN